LNMSIINPKKVKTMHVLLHLGKYEDLGKTLEGITNCGVFLNSKFPLCFSYFLAL
jgi:hypothetical protein